MARIRERLAREEGFTLIELLVVIVIIGILLAIAVPSYLGFKDRANEKAAARNVRAAVPSAEAYYADNDSYTRHDRRRRSRLAIDQGRRLGHRQRSHGGRHHVLHRGHVAATTSASRRRPGRHITVQRRNAARDGASELSSSCSSTAEGRGQPRPSHPLATLFDPRKAKPL